MANTLNGESLGTILSLDITPASDLDQIGFPLSTSKETLVMDYGGVRRVIRIRGRYIPDSGTREDLANWIVTIDALQNGQQEAIIFHSDLYDESTTGDYQAGNFNVFVQSFRITYSTEQSYSVIYELTLFEGEV